MKKNSFLLIGLSGLFCSSYVTPVVSAPICGPWNNYENCIDGRPKPPSGVDQGTYSKKRKMYFKNDTMPKFNTYKNEQHKVNNILLSMLTKDMEYLEILFNSHFINIELWEANDPKTFSDFFGNKSANDVIRDEREQFKTLISEYSYDLTEKTVNKFVALNKSTVNRIRFHYWAKAYFWPISGNSGFEPEWNYNDEIDVYSGLHDILYVSITDQNNADITENRYFDLWNNSHTGPTVKSEKLYIKVHTKKDFAQKYLDRILLSERSQPEFIDKNQSEVIMEVMTFRERLFQLIAAEKGGSIKDNATYLSAFNAGENDRSILDLNLYNSKVSAYAYISALVRKAYENDHDYKEDISNLALKIKDLTWFQQLGSNDFALSSIIKDLIEKRTSEALKTILSERFWFDQIKNVGSRFEYWSTYANIGDIRAHKFDNKVYLLKAKKSGIPSEMYWNYPNGAYSNEHWEYIGTFITNDNYKKILSSFKLNDWDSETRYGDIHKYGDHYYTPKFIGNARKLIYYYPTNGQSNYKWEHIGSVNEVDYTFYDFTRNIQRMHKVNLSNLKLLGQMLSSGDGVSVDPSRLIESESKLRSNLSGTLSQSEDGSYSIYYPIDPIISTQYHNSYDFIRNSFLKWDDWLDQRLGSLIDFNEGHLPSFSEIIRNWAVGSWEPPEGFNEWWQDISSYIKTDDADKVARVLYQMNHTQSLEDFEEVALNAEAIEVMNSMGVAASTAVSAVSTISLSALTAAFLLP